MPPQPPSPLRRFRVLSNFITANDVDRADALDDLAPIPPEFDSYHPPADPTVSVRPWRQAYPVHEMERESANRPPAQPSGVSRLAPYVSLDEILSGSNSYRGPITSNPNPNTAPDANEPLRIARTRSFRNIAARAANRLTMVPGANTHRHRSSIPPGRARMTRPFELESETADEDFEEDLLDFDDDHRHPNLEAYDSEGEEEIQESDEEIAGEADDLWRFMSRGPDPRGSGLFSLGNRTEENIAAAGQGGPTGISPLRRGGNNRSRGNNSGRGIEIVSTDVARREGMRPTNTLEQKVDPLIVRSSRSSGPSYPDVRPSKRRRTDVATHWPSEIKPVIAPIRPSYLQYTTTSPKLRLPSSLEPPVRDRLPTRLTVSTHQRPQQPPRPCVTFSFSPLPTSEPDRYAAAVRADSPIPVECGVYYYESEVLCSGESGYMSVGFCKRAIKMNRLVGWDKGSWGWHGDDGRTFAGKGIGDVFGDTWTTGDTVGCGINFLTNRAFFTKNGKLVGEAFDGLGAGLYPSIGLRTPKESLVVNFTGPFLFDIDTYVRDIRDRTWKTSLTTLRASANDIDDSLPRTTPKILNTKGIVNDVDLPQHSPLHHGGAKASAAFVLDYLRFQGHSSAAGNLRRSMAVRGWINAPQPAQPDTVDKEQDENSTLSDFASQAACLSWLHDRIIHADVMPLPLKLLEQNLDPAQMGRVNIQHYLYLLRQAARFRADPESAQLEAEEAGRVSSDSTDLDMKALSYARKCVERKKEWPDTEQKMMDEAVGLMGLDPEIWPEDGVSGSKQRAQDADAILSLVRKNLGQRPESYLETAVRQASASFRLSAKRDPAGTFIDPTRLLTDPKSFFETLPTSQTNAVNKESSSEASRTREATVSKGKGKDQAVDAMEDMKAE